MTEYKVVVGRLALADLDDAYTYAAKHAPVTAARWLERFHRALRSLETNPSRCALAPESRRTKKYVLHQYLFGSKPNVFRVIFMLEGDKVRILRVLRASRRTLTSRGIDDAVDE